jgi:hypothetical protein
VLTKASEEVSSMSKRSDALQKLIDELHLMWETVQHNCKHPNAKMIVLDYGHVQVVTVCKKCFEEGKRKHIEIVRKHGEVL